MRKKGPPKTPAALNALRGNPGHRPANPAEPKPAPAQSITAPGGLKGEAKKAWDELAPELSRLGLLTQIDTAVLASACRWWSIYRAADRRLNSSLLAETKTNGWQARPELGIAQKAFREAMRVFSRFGVTPGERLHLKAPAAKPAGDDTAVPRATDPLDQLAQRRADRRKDPA